MLGALLTERMAVHWTTNGRRGASKGVGGRLTMWRGLVILTMTACATAGLLTGAARVTPAFAQAADCTGTNVNFAGMFWQRSDNDVEGIRAPIDARTSGTICFTGGSAAAWIGIGDESSGGLTQVGFVHRYNSATGSGQWCKFWEILPSPAEFYDCDNTHNDTFTWFRINSYADFETIRYNISDCGQSGGYNPNCRSLVGTQAAYNNPVGFATAEGHSCESELMGSTSDPQKYGNTNYPLEGETGSGWAQRDFAFLTPGCADYHAGSASEGLRTWDDRVG